MPSDFLQPFAYTNDVAQQGVKQIAQDKYKAAAADASQKYLSGDTQGAIGAMMQVDPVLTQKLMEGFGNVQVQGQIKNADLAAQSQYNSTPGQVAKIGADARIQAAENRANAAEKINYRVNPQDGLIHAYQNNIDLGVPAEKGATSPKETSPSTSEGSPPTASPTAFLNPARRKQLQPFMNDFTKTKDKYDEEINGSQDVQQLIQGNLPGSKLPAVMKFLTSEEGVKRFNTDEFKELGTPGNIATEAQQALQQRIDGKPWTSDQQTFMKQLAQDTEFATFNSYLDKIQSTAKGAAAVVDKGTPEIIEPIIAAGAHPMVAKVYQAYQQAIKADPNPQVAKDAIDWARHNFQDPKAKAVLQHYHLHP